jgi:hypothetical protein
MSITVEQADQYINQRLYQARLLTDQLAGLSVKDFSSKVLVESFAVAIAVQLQSALMGLVQRVACGYGLATVTSLDEFARQLAEKGLDSAELHELDRLLAEGWLSEVKEQASILNAIPAIKMSAPDMILSDAEEVDKAALCRKWLINFKELLNRYRESSLQW